MAGRWIDWFASLTEKTTTIDGTEYLTINDASTSKKATLLNMIRYGGGSPRSRTIGNATITETTAGTLYLEVAGQTAGNARGAGAFDWQAVRSSATAVASGTGAVCIGYGGCTASGQYAVALGPNTTASGTQSVALGADSVASGTYSVTLGRATTATNTGQLTFGYSSKTTLPGCQGNAITFVTVTTDGSSTALLLDNSSARLVLPATRSVAFIGIVQAMCNVSSSSNFIKAWRIEGVITRDGSNNTRLVGTPVIEILAADTDGTQTPSTWAIASITADDTNEALAINVTGQTGQTIRWQATLLYSQVGF